MKKEWADKWVAALRSGEYKQGTRVLRSAQDEFCCLGVLCDLVGKEEWEEGPTGIAHSYRWGEDKDVSLLPLAVQKEAEVRSVFGELPYHDSLAKLNDLGASFDKIADVIEQYWREL